MVCVSYPGSSDSLRGRCNGLPPATVVVSHPHMPSFLRLTFAACLDRDLSIGRLLCLLWLIHYLISISVTGNIYDIDDYCLHVNRRYGLFDNNTTTLAG